MSLSETRWSVTDDSICLSKLNEAHLGIFIFSEGKQRLKHLTFVHIYQKHKQLTENSLL